MRRFVVLFFVLLGVPTVDSHDTAALPDGVSPSPSLTRWALDGGFGTRLWNVSKHSPEERTYLQQARMGPAWAVDVSAFPWQRLGAGLAYSGFLAEARDDDIGYGNGSRGAARDHYEIHYVAPAAYWLTPFLAGRAVLVGQAGAGVVFYRNESPTGQFPGVLEGMTWGVHAAASADYKLRPWLGLGIGARLVYGSLRDIHYNAMSTSISPISLARFDVTAGVRFYP